MKYFLPFMILFLLAACTRSFETEYIKAVKNTDDEIAERVEYTVPDKIWDDFSKNNISVIMSDCSSDYEGEVSMFAVTTEENGSATEKGYVIVNSPTNLIGDYPIESYKDKNKFPCLYVHSAAAYVGYSYLSQKFRR